MTKSISFTVTLLLASIGLAFAAPDKDAMLVKENAAWQAFKDKKADDFKKVVDHDFLGVYAEGISDMAKEMSDMAKWEMKAFSISDYKIHSDGKDVVVSTYVVKVEGTYDGKDASGTFNAGTVWKMENGKWMAIFHTNAKQAP
jgi:hypothetical protein